MSFVHEDPDFQQLLGIVARDTGIAAALVEKDYWVTHTLWALHGTGLEPAELAVDMLAQRDIAALPTVDEPALHLAEQEKRSEVERAYGKIVPMFWGPRVPLDECCSVIRSWLEQLG